MRAQFLQIFFSLSFGTCTVCNSEILENLIKNYCIRVRRLGLNELIVEVILFLCMSVLCSVCMVWKELALVIMRKCLPFLFIDANPPIDCKLHKRCPRFEWIPFCSGYTQCKPYEGFKMYIAGEMWQNLKQFFEKNAW